jgi:hypothetical protein
LVCRPILWKLAASQPTRRFSGTITHPLFIDAFSIRSKTIVGPGLPNETWNDSDGAAVVSFYPCNGCVQTKTVDIADPRGVTTRHTFGTLDQVNEGQLLRVDEGWNGAGAERVCWPADQGNHLCCGAGGAIPGPSTEVKVIPHNERASPIPAHA